MYKINISTFTTVFPYTFPSCLPPQPLPEVWETRSGAFSRSLSHTIHFTQSEVLRFSGSAEIQGQDLTMFESYYKQHIKWWRKSKILIAWPSGALCSQPAAAVFRDHGLSFQLESEATLIATQVCKINNERWRLVLSQSRVTKQRSTTY